MPRRTRRRQCRGLSSRPRLAERPPAVNGSSPPHRDGTLILLNWKVPMSRTWLSMLSLLLGAAACAPAPVPQKDPAAEAAANTAAARAAIAANNVKWADVSKRGDAQALGGMVTEDITVMGVDGADQVGRAAYVEAATKGYANRKFDQVAMQIVTDSIEVHGDYAYEIGHDISVTRPK